MGLCAFDKLFSRNVPHILELIFLSLDYESYKTCCEVSRTWNELLSSKRHQNIGKLVFQAEISRDQEKLFDAAKEGDATKVRSLLQSKMLDVNWRSFYFLITPLHRAAYYGQKEVVKLLLEKGAIVNAKSKNGDTPLCNAKEKGHRDIAYILMQEQRKLESFRQAKAAEGWAKSASTLASRRRPSVASDSEASSNNILDEAASTTSSNNVLGERSLEGAPEPPPRAKVAGGKEATGPPPPPSPASEVPAKRRRPV